MQKYDWLMLGALTTRCQHSRFDISRSLKWKTLEPEQIRALELHLTGGDVLAILPTGCGKS